MELAEHPDSMLADKNHVDTRLLLELNRGNFEEVSIIGLRYVVQPSSSIWRRIIWIALILAGTGFTVYQIQDRVLFYFTWPTSVGIRVEYVSSMRFPTVTVCNENRATRSTANNLNATAMLLALFSTIPDPNFIPPPLNYPGWNTTDGGSNGYYSWIVNYLFMSHQQSDVILSAHFNGKDLTSNVLHLDDFFNDYFKTTNRPNYDWIFSSSNTFSVTPTEIGFCFTFNSNSFNYTSVQPGGPGVLLGLQLILNVQPDEYMITNSMSTGFRVIIYDQDEYPRVKQHGFKISPGFSTQVALNSEYKTFLPFPYGDCNDTLTYKESQCLIQCLSDYVIKRCQCKDVYMTGNVSICGPNQLGSCAMPEINSFVKNNTASNCSCAHQCNTLSYNSEITQSLLSDLAVKSINATHKLNMTFDEIRRNYAVLEIFFSDLTNTYIETTATYTPFALLCDIGGALGLILGSTMLTFCELMDATLMSVLTCRFRRRQKVDQVSPVWQQHYCAVDEATRSREMKQT